MGANMSGGDNNEIYTRDACSLVSSWCSEHYKDDRSFDEWMGSYDIPVEAVIAANKEVPDSYEMAKALGFEVEDKDTFLGARAFLTEAARQNAPITGSY